MTATYELAISNRTRSTPYTGRNARAGVKAYTVYNNMLLPTRFRTDFEDYWHLCEHVQVWDVSCERQIQIKGPDANQLVQWMTPRDISLAQADQGFYLPLCDENGRIINDPIAIKVEHNTWWLSIADSEVCLWARGLALGAGIAGPGSTNQGRRCTNPFSRRRTMPLIRAISSGVYWVL